MKTIFVLATTRPAVPGNFAINVTVRRETSHGMKSDAVGVNVTSLSLPSFSLMLQHYTEHAIHLSSIK